MTIGNFMYCCIFNTACYCVNTLINSALKCTINEEASYVKKVTFKLYLTKQTEDLVFQRKGVY